MANVYNICQKLQAIADAITQGGGGGGTTVVANPTGTPTDDLDTIQIGNTIYDIPGSGGGVGTIIPLYQSSQFAQTITLAGDLFNYDMIFVEVSDGNGYKRGLSYAVDELAQANIIGFDNTYGYIWYTITNGVTLTNMAQNNFYISSITGVSMGSSGAYTFDTTPTQGSTNPVTSNGIYDAVEDVNNNVGKWELILRKGSGGQSTETVPDMSKYKTIIVCMASGGYVLGSTEYPFSEFKSNSARIFVMRFVSGSEVQVWAQYVSDTSLSISIAAGYGLEVWGVK